MPRLSIDITAKELRQLKTLAELSGKSIKEYILEHTIPPQTEEEALQQLNTFLKPRIEEAERGEFADVTFEQIKHEARENFAP